MDNLIIPSRTEKERVENLCEILSTASEYELEINWKKCQFLERKILYLGHSVENGCLRLSERKTAAVIKFPKPKCARDVQFPSLI